MHIHPAVNYVIVSYIILLASRPYVVSGRRDALGVNGALHRTRYIKAKIK